MAVRPSSTHLHLASFFEDAPAGNAAPTAPAGAVGDPLARARRTEPVAVRSGYEDRLWDPKGGVIPDNVPVIVLRGDDPTAWRVALEMARLHAEAGVADAICARTAMMAERMRTWPGQKLPELPKEADDAGR